MRDLPAAKSVLIESHGRVGVRGRHIYINILSESPPGVNSILVDEYN